MTIATTMPISTSWTPEKQQSRRISNLKRWRNDPVAFVVQCIGATPDPWQVEALRALRRHRRLTVAACHGVGKDTLAAWCVLWVMVCWKDCKIPCTAPTSHQLYDLLWSEIAKWLAKMPPLYRTLFDLKKDRMERKTRPETWFAAARTARKENSEALQGFHAEVILVVVDEASGVPPIIFEVLEGALTGPLAFCLIIGNPTQTTGYFYESHHKDRARWAVMRVLAAAAHDGTRLAPGTYASDRPSSGYVADMGRKYGKQSNVYRVRVLGQFPKSEDDQVIPLEWVELARARELPDGWTTSHHVVMGVDVARTGADDTAIVVRQGRRVVGMATWNGNNTVDSSGKVLAACRKLAARGEKPRFIFVDGVGVGAGVVDVLRGNDELRANGIAVVEIQAGGKSPDPECQRMRDALWWRARKAFDPQQGVPQGHTPVFPATLDPALTSRLTAEMAGPKFSYTPSLKIVVESKDDMKDRGVDSPDLADAYVMTFAFEAGMPPPKNPKDYLFDRKGAPTAWVMP